MCVCGEFASLCRLTLTIGTSSSLQKMVNFVCDKRHGKLMSLFGVSVMSQTLATPTKPAPARTGASDSQMLTQVEKWMATIREITREQQDEIKLRV